MADFVKGLNKIRKKITVDAPADVCYRAWVDSQHLVNSMKRVLGVQEVSKDPGMYAVDNVQHLNQGSHAGKVKQWFFAGPGGKLYEVENTVVLDIPNHFYCTTSTDPNDLAFQSSVMFSPDEMNQTTLVEVQVSFWGDSKGKLTQFILDILKTNDNFLDECLADFKAQVEKGQPAR